MLAEKTIQTLEVFEFSTPILQNDVTVVHRSSKFDETLMITVL